MIENEEIKDSTAIEISAPIQAPAQTQRAVIPAPKTPVKKGFTRDNGNVTIDGLKHLAVYDESYTEDICPGCSYDIAHEVGTTEDGKRIVECTCCETTFVSGLSLPSIAAELKDLFAKTKDGEKVTIKKPFRSVFTPPLQKFATENVLYTRGGIHLPAERAGFEIVSFDRGNGWTVLRKPKAE